MVMDPELLAAMGELSYIKELEPLVLDALIAHGQVEPRLLEGDSITFTRLVHLSVRATMIAASHVQGSPLEAPPASVIESAKRLRLVTP